MSDLIGNPEDRFSHNEAHFKMCNYFAQIEEKVKTAPYSEKAQVEPKEEWAINVDINTPVDDFYKRIPVMAYKVGFFMISRFLAHLSRRLMVSL